MIDKAIDHPKMRRLARMLKIPIAYANGIMERLWHATETHALHGGIGIYSDEDIWHFCGCGNEIDPEELVRVLIKCGWLDLRPTCRLFIHDWPDHCTHFVHNKLARNRMFFANNQAPAPTRVPVDDQEKLLEFYRLVPHVWTREAPIRRKRSIDLEAQSEGNLSAQNANLSAQIEEKSAQNGQKSAQNEQESLTKDGKRVKNDTKTARPSIISAQNANLSAQIEEKSAQNGQKSALHHPTDTDTPPTPHRHPEVETDPPSVTVGQNQESHTHSAMNGNATNGDSGFQEFVRVYPRHHKRKEAEQIWNERVTESQKPAVMACLQRYMESDEVLRGVIMNPDKWLRTSADNEWKSDWPRSKQKRDRAKETADLMRKKFDEKGFV